MSVSSTNNVNFTEPLSWGEWALNNRYLERAVFGTEESRAGKPQEVWRQNRLQFWQTYIDKTAQESVQIPFSKAGNLTGFFFGSYDEHGKIVSFDSKSITCLLLSASFAPFQTYSPAIIEGYRKAGVQVLAVNYVGFGENLALGSPSPTALHATAEASFQYLLSRGINESCLIVHGNSIGGFPATQLCAKYKSHLVLDRVSQSTQAIAYSQLQNKESSYLRKAGAYMLSNFAQIADPFSLKEDLLKVTGKIFVAQENREPATTIGADLLVQELHTKGALKASEVMLHKVGPLHFSSPTSTWTANGKKLAEKFGIDFYKFTGADEEKAARKAWKDFIKTIRAEQLSS